MCPFTNVKDKTKSATTYTKAVYSLTCHKGAHLPPLTFQQGFKELERRLSFKEKTKLTQSLIDKYSIKMGFLEAKRHFGSSSGTLDSSWLAAMGQVNSLR